MVTANHFWIDAALGVLVAGDLRVRPPPYAFARARPEAWAWRTARGRGDRVSTGPAAAPAPSARRGGTRRGARSRRGRVPRIARNRLIESRLTPNAISLTGFVGNVIAAVLVCAALLLARGHRVHPRLALRHVRRPLLAHVREGHPFGAFLDSTLDRVEEGIVLAAVAAWFAEHRQRVRGAAVVLAVLVSLMGRYTRARAEALGVECKGGIATRAVRVVILSAGLLFAEGASLGTSNCSSPPST